MEKFKRILEKTNAKNKDMFLNDGLTRVLYPQEPPLTRKVQISFSAERSELLTSSCVLASLFPLIY